MPEKNDCIVCAKTFVDPGMERITCSKECSEKWQEFLLELKTVSNEEREQKMDRFFSPLYIKMTIERQKFSDQS